MTFAELNEQYLHGFLGGRLCHDEFVRVHQQYFSEWKEHPTRPFLRQWHRENEKTPTAANKALGYLKAMYNYAIRMELWTDENPTAGILRYRTLRRERTLTQREAHLAVKSLDLFTTKFGALFLLLMTTGARVGEAVVMEWSHIDIEAGVWNKPTAKNDQPMRVPLPRQTCEALGSLKRSGTYVFRGNYGHHLSRNAVNKKWREVRSDLRMKDVRINDLRRTLAFRLQEQGEPDRVIKAILNHHRCDANLYFRAAFDTQAKALQKHADGLIGQLTICKRSVELGEA